MKKNTESSVSRWYSYIKNLKTWQWGILLLVGILLAILAMPGKSEKIGNKNSEEMGTETEKEKLEKNMEEILSQVEGIGKIKVLLTVEEKKDSFYGENKNLTVTGVLVVTEGGDDPIIIRNIQQAVMALFPVEAHKIKVMKMK